jgi:hypothetical protein
LSTTSTIGAPIDLSWTVSTIGQLELVLVLGATATGRERGLDSSERSPEGEPEDRATV